MPKLSDTIARLKAFKTGRGLAAGADRLSDLADFGPNPGALRARCYVPEPLAPGAALVVVLHGCTQTAGGYDHGSGWSDLADRYGFALLYPEQTHANNPAGCFNWFAADDTRRGGGEAMSIHQMVLAMTDRHDIDPERVFITGLSAGAAMAMAMLATYPELFAGGAIIAGLPYGCASSVPEALSCMRGQGLPSTAELRRRVHDASKHGGPWPLLSVWHGSADHTVAVANADAILAQWLGVHGLADEPNSVQSVAGHSRRLWLDGAGREAVESWLIAGMGHGTPLDTGPGGCGAAGAFMLDVCISSTQWIAHHWGLAPAPSAQASQERRVRQSHPTDPLDQPAGQSSGRRRRSDAATSSVGEVIEGALSAAGLMR